MNDRCPGSSVFRPHDGQGRLAGFPEGMPPGAAGGMTEGEAITLSRRIERWRREGRRAIVRAVFVPVIWFVVCLAALALLGLSACGGGSSSPSGLMPDAPPGPAAEVRVIDADTVDIDGMRWRLFGIDAPESRQTCRAWGRTWDCGAAATEALMSRAEGMSCEGSGTDRYGRSIGVCSSGGEDLNAWLVANGWALAYRQYADDYADEEEEARANGRGIHAGAHVAPWDWRWGGRLGGEDTFAWVASGDLDAGALADRMLRGDRSRFYGRWLDDSVFGLVDGVVAVSFGAFPATNPAGIGGGVWRGSMVAADARNGRRVEGIAEIRIEDFSRPAVDVVFGGVADAIGVAGTDIRWEDIPLARGAFRAGDGRGWIEGRFYGRDHGEVGGVFEWNGFPGAFGAER